MGKVSEEIQIQTKSFIYKIPVSGYIITNEEHEKLEEENLKRTGKRLKTYAKIYIKEVNNNISNVYFDRFQKNFFQILT